MSTERYMRRAVCDWLVAQQMTPVFEVSVRTHTCDFVGAEFGERAGRRMPPLLRTVAVELKLSDVAGVLRQCKSCRYMLTDAYAAMPRERCQRMNSKTLAKFSELGVGLLAVGDEIEVVLKSAPSDRQLCELWQRDLQRKLWRRRDEWQPRLEQWELSQRASTT